MCPPVWYVNKYWKLKITGQQKYIVIKIKDVENEEDIIKLENKNTVFIPGWK